MRAVQLRGQVDETSCGGLEDVVLEMGKALGYRKATQQRLEGIAITNSNDYTFVAHHNIPSVEEQEAFEVLIEDYAADFLEEVFQKDSRGKLKHWI
jgi:hypothetical protein